MPPTDAKSSHVRRFVEIVFAVIFIPLVVVVLAPVVLAFLLAVFIPWIIRRGVTLLLVWTLWCPRGKTILFVTSDSPIWKEYIDHEVLPHILPHTVVVNWSRRRQLSPCSLRCLAISAYLGDTEFNPAGIVFRPFRRTKVYRFFHPFKKYKRGFKEPVLALTAEFLNDARTHGTRGF